MVYLKLIEANDSGARYEYMPEREDAPSGIIHVSSSLKRTIEKPSEADSLNTYAIHGLRAVARYVKEGRAPEQSYAAWY